MFFFLYWAKTKLISGKKNERWERKKKLRARAREWERVRTEKKTVAKDWQGQRKRGRRASALVIHLFCVCACLCGSVEGYRCQAARFLLISTYSWNANNNSVLDAFSRGNCAFLNIPPRTAPCMKPRTKSCMWWVCSPHDTGATMARFIHVTALFPTSLPPLSVRPCLESVTTSSRCRRIPWCPRRHTWRWCSSPTLSPLKGW